MDARERFLAQVAAQLPLPDEVRAEVLEEVAAHLDDATAEMVALGRGPAEAQADAIARLGLPATLARGLSRAHRPPTRLLAAAGAGTWAALREGVRGAVLAWVFLMLALLVGMTLTHAVGGWLGLDVNVSWDSGWNTLITALGLHAGALFAGAAAVPAVARGGWRSPSDVRIAVMLIGGAGIAWIVLVMLEQALNWASVIALLLVPVSFVTGARLRQLNPPRASVVVSALVIGMVGFGAASVLSTAASGGGAMSYSWSTLTHGYEMIGPWWQDPGSNQSPAFIGEDSEWSAPGAVTFSVDAANAEVAAQFHGFRLEAWRAEPPGDGWRLIYGQRAPFATARSVLNGTSIHGTLRFNRTPGVSWAQVVLTGIGPDGTRYLLEASGPEQTEFRGSVWDWISAFISR